MQLQTSHSAFKGSIVIFGNAITNHQESIYFAVKDHMPTHGLVDETNGKRYLNTHKGRWYGTTKEQLTEDNLEFLRRYIPSNEYKTIINEALTCGQVCAGVIRANGRKYGYFVMDENARIIAASCFINHHKAATLVDQFIKALQLDHLRCIQGQVDYITKSIKGCTEQSEAQLLQTRLDALQIELTSINKVLYC